MSEKQYPLHHDHGTVTISRDVFESMTAELERLRPMECSLELAEADRDAYKKKVEELKGELKDVADDRNEFKQLYSEQTEKLCIEKTNVDTLEQAWRQSQRALWMARAEICHRLDVDRYLRNHRNSWYNENCLTWDEACVAMEVKMCKAESKCRSKAEEHR